MRALSTTGRDGVTVKFIRACCKFVDCVARAADSAAEPIPGQNGRLFGYRPSQKYGRLPCLDGGTKRERTE